MLSQNGGMGNGSTGGTLKGILLCTSPDFHNSKIALKFSRTSDGRSAAMKIIYVYIIKNYFLHYVRLLY